MPHKDWFDDSLGVASIGGSVIYSDPLHAARHDRVMPLWPEEHLVTAELLDRCLVSGSRVLDLGTGSGVFAIQAARKGCRVLAIDCNARALSFAFANAKRNEIAVSFETGGLSEGAIVLRHGFAAAGSEGDLVKGIEGLIQPQVFDAIILTPPYTLAYPPVSPALHAEAGEDGQETFRVMTTAAMPHLAEDGLIICNQMSTVDAAGRITAIDYLRDQFAAHGRGLKVTVCPCLGEEKFDTRTFLKRQYEELLAHAKVHNPDLENEINAYIDRISRDFPELTMFSLVAQSAELGSFELATDHALKRFALRANRGWNDRIRLHAEVIATAVPPRALSLPDLMVSVRDASSLSRWTEPREKADSDPGEDPPSVPRQATRRLGFDLDILDVDNCDAPGLDIVVIDAAPISENVIGYAGLSHEMTLWVSSRLRRQVGDRVSEVVEQIATAWQENTRLQQHAHAGLFLHPWFTGAASASDWTLMQHSVRFRSDDGEMHGSIAAPERWFAAWTRRINRNRTTGATTSDLMRPRAADGITLFEISLKDAHVDKPMSVAAGIATSGRFDALIQLPTLRERQGRLPQINRAIKDRIEAGGLNVFTLLGELPLPDRSLITELFAADADFCHLRMHQALDGHVARIIGQAVPVGWSSLGGLPLRIQEISESPRSPGLPEQYRGGAWIYAASCFGSPADSIEMEKIALRASKSIWLNCLDRFAVKSAKNMMESALHEASHQLAHLASAVAKSARATPNIPQLICDGTHVLAATLRLFQGRNSNRHTLDESVPVSRIVNSALLAAQIRLEEKSYLDVAEPLRKALLKIRVEQEGKSLMIIGAMLERLGGARDDLPERWEFLERETRFVVLLFHAVWQAFYHAVEFQLVESKQSIFSISFREVNADTLRVEVKNSGPPLDKGAAPPKDVKALDTLASGMLDTKVEGPLYEDDSWVVRLDYSRSTPRKRPR